MHPTAHEQIVFLQTNIQRSYFRLFNVFVCNDDLSTQESIHQLSLKVREAISDEQCVIANKRLDTFKEKLIKDWNSNRRETYKWVRDQAPLMYPCFKNDDHQYFTTHPDLHKMMINSWGPIFNRYKNCEPPPYEVFCQKFPHAIPHGLPHDAHNPFVLPPISSTDLKQLISKLKHTSPGVDFWRAHELQMLGPISLQNLAQLFQLIEDLQQWPTTLLEVPVAAIKKNAGLTPLDNRPIALTSSLYRLWAKLRWNQLQQWYHEWIPSELKGGVTDRQAIDSYFQVALEIEQSQFDKHPIFGILYEYEKCFDNIAWSIEKGLLTDLGMPQKTLGAMFAFNQQIKRRFKFGDSVGPAFPNTNSIFHLQYYESML